MQRSTKVLDCACVRVIVLRQCPLSGFSGHSVDLLWDDNLPNQNCRFCRRHGENLRGGLIIRLNEKTNVRFRPQPAALRGNTPIAIANGIALARQGASVV